MSMVSEKTVSIWMANVPKTIPNRPALAESLHAEIVVIGAGIAGLSVAYRLSQSGRKVVVLDDGDIGGGNTSRTTAHLSNALDDRFSKLAHERGAAVARIAAASHGAAIDFIEDVQRRERIDCGFHRLDGYLILGEGDEERVLDEELEAAHAAGLSDVEKLSHPPAGIPVVPCLRFRRQARFEPLAYQRGLAGAIEKNNGRIFCGSHVISVEDGNPVTVDVTNGYRVTADYAVVATATPINDRVRLHTKLAPYRSYAVAAHIADGVLPDVLIWDTLDPYHYIRLAEYRGSTYAILGGEDHKTGQSDSEIEAMQRLEDWARGHFKIGDVAFRWSGQVMETIDGLGLIGRNPGDKNIYVVTGDSGMGITHGTIAAILIPALISTGSHPWEAAYDPGRKPLGAAATFVAENMNAVAQFADFVKRSDVKGFEDIPVEEGAVLRHGLSKIAAFRDDRGLLHVRSAVCPHLGCIVHWNRLEKVWDCPCHGSQFGPTGQVLHGPSVAPLATVEDFNNQRNPNLPDAAE